MKKATYSDLYLVIFVFVFTFLFPQIEGRSLSRDKDIQARYSEGIEISNPTKNSLEILSGSATSGIPLRASNGSNPIPSPYHIYHVPGTGTTIYIDLPFGIPIDKTATEGALDGTIRDIERIIAREGDVTRELRHFARSLGVWRQPGH